MVGIVPTEPSGEGRDLRTGLCFIAKRPLSGRLTRSVAALLPVRRANARTGSSDVANLAPGPDLLFPAKHLFFAAMVAISPAERSGMGNWGLFGNGNSLNPVDAKGALPPAYPPSQTCRRPMVLHRKSNAGTMNPHRSSGDEWAIADTQLKPARTDNTVSWLAINDPRSDIFTAAKFA